VARSRSRSMHRGGKDKGDAKGKGKQGKDRGDAKGKGKQGTASEQGSARDGTITIEPVTRSGDHIYLSFPLFVEPDDTVAYCKRLIQSYLGPRPSCQRLKFQGRPLEEMHTLSYYGIVMGPVGACSVVHLRWDQQGQRDVERHL